MKQQLLLFTLISLLALQVQSCKKSGSDDTTTTAATTLFFQDYVNGTLWTPTTNNTVLTYNATAKTKTLICTATNISNYDKLVFSIVIAAANAADNTFTPQTYAVDGSAVTAMYYVLNANNIYTAVGKLTGGSIVISTFDSTANTMTGTFNFSFIKNNYDTYGNVMSITSNGITAGQFNNLPFTFVKQ